MKRVVFTGVLAFAAACGPKAMITETRMVMAPAREPTCALELVSPDVTAVSFNSTWDVLGYVTLSDHSFQDPTAEENRALVRPRACAMGGTSIAIAASSTATDYRNRQGSGLVYMVLRPKPATPPAPASF